MFRLMFHKKSLPCKMVIRVEDGSGEGLYQGLWEKAVLRGFKGYSEHEFNMSFPEPNKDIDFNGKIRIASNKNGSYMAMPDYFSAFINKEQFLSWIHQKEWRERIEELGGVLVFYEVPEIFIINGSKQVLFRKKKAKKIKIESLLYYD